MGCLSPLSLRARISIGSTDAARRLWLNPTYFSPRLSIIYSFSITYYVFAIPNGKAPLSIGENIRRLRRARGISLGELAKEAGISKSTLSSIEAGKANTTVSTLWAISKALGVPSAPWSVRELLLRRAGPMLGWLSVGLARRFTS